MFRRLLNVIDNKNIEIPIWLQDCGTGLVLIYSLRVTYRNVVPIVLTILWTYIKYVRINSGDV